MFKPQQLYYCASIILAKVYCSSLLALADAIIYEGYYVLSSQ